MSRMTITDFLNTAFHKCDLIPGSYFYSYKNTDLDYASFRPVGPNRNVEIDDWFEVSITIGASEGLYLEIWMFNYTDGVTTKVHVGTIKTLSTSLTAFKDLGALGGELLYHLQHTNFRT